MGVGRRGFGGGGGTAMRGERAKRERAKWKRAKEAHPQRSQLENPTGSLTAGIYLLCAWVNVCVCFIKYTHVCKRFCYFDGVVKVVCNSLRFFTGWTKMRLGRLVKRSYWALRDQRQQQQKKAMQSAHKVASPLSLIWCWKSGSGSPPEAMVACRTAPPAVWLLLVLFLLLSMAWFVVELAESNGRSQNCASSEVDFANVPWEGI